jgi:hypothetical protein
VVEVHEEEGGRSFSPSESFDFVFEGADGVASIVGSCEVVCGGDFEEVIFFLDTFGFVAHGTDGEDLIIDGARIDGDGHKFFASVVIDEGDVAIFFWEGIVSKAFDFEEGEAYNFVFMDDVFGSIFLDSEEESETVVPEDDFVFFVENEGEEGQVGEEVFDVGVG